MTSAQTDPDRPEGDGGGDGDERTAPSRVRSLDPGAPDNEPPDDEPPDDAVRAAASAAAELAGEAGPERVVRGLAFAIARRVPATERDPAEIAGLVRHGIDVLDGRAPGELRVAIDGRPWDGGGQIAPHTEDASTRLDVTCEDGPYLLATALAELRRQGLAPTRVLHPVLGVERDEARHLTAVVPARDAEQREAWLHLVLDTALEAARVTDVVAGIRDAVGEARVVGAATPTMRRTVAAAAEALEEAAATEPPVRHAPRTDVADAPGAPDAPAEVAALLRWLLDDRFALLGLVDRGGARYGLAERFAAEPVGEAGPLEVRTLGVTSPVLRREPLVEITAGGLRLLGLFEREAHGDPVDAVPVARRRLAAVAAAEDLVEGSHDERALRGLFTSLPLPDQLSRSVASLRRDLVPLLAVRERSGVAVRWRIGEDADARVLVIMPRDRYAPEVRERVMRRLTTELGGVGAEAHVAFGDATVDERGPVLLQVVVRAGENPLVEPAPGRLQRVVLDCTRTWEDRVVAVARDEQRALARAWAGALPRAYQAQVDPQDALEDLTELSAVPARDGAARMRLVARPDGRVRARLYRRGEGVELSTLLPVLEHLGLVVVDERPYRVERDGDTLHLHDVGLRIPEGGPSASEVNANAGLAAEAVLAGLDGRAEPDDLDRLVLVAGLGWQDVTVLRAYRRLRRQLGVGFTEAYQGAALVRHPAVARGLLELLAARLSPEVTDASMSAEQQAEARAEAERAAREELDEALAAVDRFDEDRILRGFAGLIEATLRTNRWLEPWPGRLALKLDSAAAVEAAGLPVPVTGPKLETFVYAPTVEGVHLRAARVARGGVRHSDRREDVRTEVLGLVRAQQQKNAMIVPEGAKGGFVPKNGAAPEDAYRTFVRGLLDLADDVRDGEAVSPARVVAPDGPDPYLVVAPDRGTATFSDTANGLAAERGFWLGDAFASGGSRGFDHKRMGITARGAWVAVRRHFAALGIDVDTDPITVVGIGDMSGDVFGNALLQSRAVRLVAAFDHRDVFLDPTGAPERGYEARRALFERGRSTWQDYDRSALGAGGGVWSRSAKEIPLTDEVRELLAIEADALTPPELIRAVLGAPVDLLFAGGVGTFVKASWEANTDVADRGNDAIRVDARDLRARVVGEGANLALTQHARVEYARRGGRCHTDSVDNAAGVATSDAEVNLKILLDARVRAGELSSDERHRLIADAEEEVAAAVLADCDRQVRALAREVTASQGQLDAYASLAARLERSGRVDAGEDALPDAEELGRRRRADAGLSRPELAVLHAGAKLDLRARLLEGDLPDEPALAVLLREAFPASVRARIGDDRLGEHRLRRELITARLVGDLVDRMGATWVDRVVDETGVGVDVVVRSWWVAREVTGVLGLSDRLADVEPRCEPGVVAEAQRLLVEVVDRTARAYLPDARPIGAAVAADTPAAAPLRGQVAAFRARRRRGDIARWTDGGVPSELAEELAAAADVALVPDIAAVARDVDAAPERVAEAFAAVEEALPLAAVARHLARAPREGRWVRRQRSGLVDDLRRARRRAARTALREWPDLAPPDAVAHVLAVRPGLVARAQEIAAAVADEDEPSLDAVAVAVRVIRDVAAMEGAGPPSVPGSA